MNEGGAMTSVCLGFDAILVYVWQGAIVSRRDVYQGNNEWTKDWKLWLTIEIFPSLSGPESRFSYFNDEGDDGTEMEIVMTTDKRVESVKVVYGDLETEGTLVVYTTGGKMEKTVVKGGGEVVFKGVKCLF